MLIEYWHWHYRDLKTGLVRTTTEPMSVADALKLLSEPQRIAGTMTLRNIPELDFPDTAPWVQRKTPK